MPDRRSASGICLASARAASTAARCRLRARRLRRDRLLRASENIRRSSWRWVAGRVCRARGGQDAPGRRPAGRAGDRPRRWILPMTALRVTPICGGDLAASQACDDKVAELFDALRGPGFDGHANGLVECRGRFWAADRAKAARNGRRERCKCRKARNRWATARRACAPRSPSRIRADRIASPQAFKRHPYAGQTGPL